MEESGLPPGIFLLGVKVQDIFISNWRGISPRFSGDERISSAIVAQVLYKGQLIGFKTKNGSFYIFKETPERVDLEKKTIIKISSVELSFRYKSFPKLEVLALENLPVKDDIIRFLSTV